MRVTTRAISGGLMLRQSIVQEMGGITESATERWPRKTRTTRPSGPRSPPTTSAWLAQSDSEPTSQSRQSRNDHQEEPGHRVSRCGVIG